MKKNKLWYITKKLLVFVASVLILSILTFYISRLAPGDPLVSYYGERVEKMSPEEREWAEDKLGKRCTEISGFPTNIKWMCWR